MKFKVLFIFTFWVFVSCSMLDPNYEPDNSYGKRMGCIAVLVSYNACTGGSTDPDRQNSCLTESIVAGGSCFVN